MKQFVIIFMYNRELLECEISLISILTTDIIDIIIFGVSRDVLCCCVCLVSGTLMSLSVAMVTDVLLLMYVVSL